MAISNSLAGHSPPILGSPGSFALTSTIPPVKQNLFQPWIIADWTYFASV